MYLHIILFSAIVFAGCRQAKSLQVYSLHSQKYINYDKVRVEFSNGRSTYSLKGFIRFQMDSSLCFQFWGPMGYEVIRGYFRNGLLQTKTNENINVSKASVENFLGLVIDNTLIQNLFLGFDSLLVNDLAKQNSALVQFTDIKIKGNTTSVSMYHKANKRNMEITYKKENGLVRTIRILINPESVEIVVQILEVSYINKLCNFMP
jgi:hypothetical protein